jgi:hypothetical protein
MNFKNDELVKSCRKLERGLRFGPEGVRACQIGPYASPIYWSEEEASALQEITKDMIIEQRKKIFYMLNDNHSETACKQCTMVEIKPFKDVDFTKLGHIDHAPRTICNLRCDYCGYTHAEDRGDLKNAFVETDYDSLRFLKTFALKDISWDAFVDFNGGETSLIKNVAEYLDFFKKMKIRVLLYTNAVQFSKPIYDGLADGSIEWVVTSVDAGTPSTWKKTKRADVFEKVIENCAKYAHAGSKSKGMFAVKYIFTENNCSQDDISGFAYAMLAIRPQKIWLTFDFTPFGEIGGLAEDFGNYDFSKQIDAYVSLFIQLKKYGLEPVHYIEGHLALISNAGKRLMREIKSEISRREMKSIKSELEIKATKLQDFRQPKDVSKRGSNNIERLAQLNISEMRISDSFGQHAPWTFEGKKIVFAPAWQYTRSLLKNKKVQEGNVVAMLDRSPAIHGKMIENVVIHDYSELDKLAVDVVVVAPPAQHRQDIVDQVLQHIGSDCRVLLINDGKAVA